MKQEKTVKIISNILFALGIALGVASLVKSYIDSANLPAGVCPIVQNRWLTAAALAVLIAALAFAFLTDHLKRKKRSKGE